MSTPQPQPHKLGDVAGSGTLTDSIPSRDGRGGERPSFLGLPLWPFPCESSDEFDEEDATD